MILNNKKGFSMELIALMIVGITVISFFAIFIYGFGIMNTNLNSVVMDTNIVNFTKASGETIGNLNAGIQNLRGISTAIIFGFILATLITAWFSGKHPIWIFVYIFITILLIISSFYISNAYEKLQADSTFGATISSFGVSGFMVSYLPYLIAVTGLLGIGLCIVSYYYSRRNM